ncbi:hypothetical protein [Prosthecomicrobium pneumaticum]|uniref:Nucleotide-diphospho-sugar transferase domain-containing protein n=1 Tax=Prosthecomicrobium pneumaticum TaxID=81895 RepID=A0A7W9CTA7_9HYPH|nr:hypothetical protein [Prosthecomicrobium pneumaticum]MBB5751158.1 hypothetical protein [Prosthecomicrobium pneumaticum]
MSGRYAARTTHIAYATSDLAQAARLAERYSQRAGLRAFRLYGPHSPVARDLAERHPEIMAERRGAGYWLWKPAIIADALRASRPGDLVLYTDVAMTLVGDPEPLLALADEHPIVLFEMGGPVPQRLWTKRDCFVSMDADTPAFWENAQLVSGFQLYRAGPEAEAFVAEMARAFPYRERLTDDPNRLGLPNFDGFIEHRHDQSVLTILSQKAGLPRFPDPSQFGPRVPRRTAEDFGDGLARPPTGYGQVFHCHRLRDRSVASRLKHGLRGDYTGRPILFW